MQPNPPSAAEHVSETRIIDHRVTDRVHTGLYLRVRLSDGRQRSVFLPQALLETALRGGPAPAGSEAVPTDGGRPLAPGLTAELLARLVRHTPTWGSIEGAMRPPRPAPRGSQRALAVGAGLVLALAAAAAAWMALAG